MEGSMKTITEELGYNGDVFAKYNTSKQPCSNTFCSGCRKDVSHFITKNYVGLPVNCTYVRSTRKISGFDDCLVIICSFTSCISFNVVL